MGKHRSETIQRVRRDGLTYLEVDALLDLTEVAIANEEKKIAGCIVEAGCALGGSALVLTNAKATDRQLLVFDVFGTIPPPSEMDGLDVIERYDTIVSGKSVGIQGKRYYGYEEDLLGKVEASFQQYSLELNENNVTLIKGTFEDMMNIDTPVALAHIDCDWYSSVRTCLERIVPKLSLGGTLVIDDYDTWSGCRRAVDDFFDSIDMTAFYFTHESRLHVIKRAAMKRVPTQRLPHLPETGELAE